jgi:hypothetical protein
MKKIPKVGNRSNTCAGTKVFLKGRKPGFFVNFCHFPNFPGSGSAFPIRIRIRIQDSQNNGGSVSGSLTLVIKMLCMSISPFVEVGTVTEMNYMDELRVSL